MKILDDVLSTHPNHFRFYVLLNRPPIGWTEGVGYIEPRHIRRRLIFPPRDGDLIVMCGPPVFEAAMRGTLQKVGFKKEHWFSFSEDDQVSAHL